MTTRISAFTFVLCAVALGASIAAAQTAPAQLPMQGFLTDTAGEPVDRETTMVFALYTADTGGAPIYSETQTVTVEAGYFTAEIGGATALDLGLFRDNGTVFVGIQVGADPEMTPRLPLGSVPYAAFAQNAASAGAVAANAVNSAAVADGSLEAADLAATALGAAGTIDIGGNTTNATPTEIDSITVTAPGPGTLTVLAFMDTFIDCDSTVASTRICSTAAIGICDAGAVGTAASCGTSYRTIWHEDPDNTNSLNKQHFLSMGRTFTVDAAGARRVFINAQGPEAGRTIDIRGYVLVQFQPSPALTVTNP
jgi:hypothetical protein